MKTINELEKILKRIDKCYEIGEKLEKLEAKRYQSYNEVLFLNCETVLRKRTRSIVMDLGLDIEINDNTPSTCVMSLIEQINDYVRNLIRKIERFNNDVIFQYNGQSYKF